MRSIFIALAMLCACARVADAAGFHKAHVRAAARAAGLADLADRAAAAARPTVTIDRTIEHAPGERGTSRFGGRPDLPAGLAWPRCKGKGQTFLAQIRVPYLPAAAAALRRLGGTLLFFTYVPVEEPTRTYRDWGGDCVTVVPPPAGAPPRRAAPAPPPGAPLVRTAPAKRAVVLKVPGARMRFKTGIDLPDVSEDYETLGGPLFGV